MKRTLFLAAGLLALAVPAAAQTGYGQPSPGQYRQERRTTADLNRQAREAAWDGRDDRGYGYGYDAPDDRRPPLPDRYAQERADYARERSEWRRRNARHRADLRRWRERVAACNAGVRAACAGYEERYGSYADGRYAAPYGGTLPGRDDAWRQDRPNFRDGDRYDAPDPRWDDEEDDRPFAR